jgi:hypothetical protein
MTQDRFETIIDKLDAFIRKYYFNRLIKGSLYFIGFSLGFILLIDLLEHVFRFGILGRQVLFFVGLLSLSAVFIVYITTPIFKIFHLGKQLNHRQASEIIGKHFSAVQDKLLNTLQLHEMANNENTSDLLLASIEQKSSDLNTIPFKRAIDFKKNKKYLKYVFIPIGITIIILLVSPTMITSSSERIVNYNNDYVAPAPFEFIVENESLDIPKNLDLQIDVRVEGQIIPAVVYIENHGQVISMIRKGANQFSYRFKNLKESFDFRLKGDQYYSSTYEVNVFPNPLIKRFTIDLDFPAYLNMDAQKFTNQGDLLLPEGTKIRWQVDTEDADDLAIRINDSLQFFIKSGNEYEYTSVASTSQYYNLFVSNEFEIGDDSLQYKLEVIPDRYPMISLESLKDSVSNQVWYFNGKIEDDYGFRRLRFYYREIDEQNQSWKSKNIKFAQGVNQSLFFHVWELDELNLAPGTRLEYYFEVTDNDGVNGGKSSKTKAQSINLPTQKELKKLEEDQNAELKDDLKESSEEAKRLRKEFERLKRDFIEKKDLSWQDKKQLENLLNQQMDLQNKLKDMKNDNLRNQKQQEEFNKNSENILEKQEQINKLFDELMNDEMKKLYEEIQKLMEELNKDQIQEKMDEVDFSNEDLEKELDRTLELFKQLELEKKVNDTVEKLEKLAKEQKELSKETLDKKNDTEELKEKQEELNEEFEEIKKDLEDIQKKNEELENPMPIDEQKEEQEKVDEEMSESKENLEKKKRSKASENQDNAGNKMEDMAQSLMSQMQSAEQESMEEDMNALRKLLSNIVDLSIDQEALMDEVIITNKTDPRFIELAQQQRKLKEDALHIGDSLYALSKRVGQIEGIVNKEMSQVNKTMGNALEMMADRNSAGASMNQQYTMTSLNNLSLLLDEALQQLQQQMASKMPGTGNCEKPGGQGKKPSASDINKMQKALSKQLEEMKNQMSKGENKGGKSGNKNPGMSKEIAQMAAEQSAIRERLEQLANELNGQGKGEGNELKKIAKEMEENEKDLVNQNLSRQTMLRQQDILGRLLKAEKAEREREWDEKRKSEEAKNQKYSNPEQFSKYNEMKRKESEMFETLPPDLKPYYKKKVSEYFNKLENE